MKIYLVMAHDQNKLVGDGDRLPWKIAEEMKTFTDITFGKVVVVGANTYKTLPRLIGRKIIVVDHTLERSIDRGIDVTTVKSVGMLWELGLEEDIYVIGGSQLAKYMVNKRLVDTMLISEIHQAFEAKNPVYLDINFDNYEMVAKVKREEYTLKLYELGRGYGN